MGLWRTIERNEVASLLYYLTLGRELLDNKGYARAKKAMFLKFWNTFETERTSSIKHEEPEHRLSCSLSCFGLTNAFTSGCHHCLP